MDTLKFAVCPPTPSRLKPVPLSLRPDSGTQSRARRITYGTGFSREEASVDTLKFAVCPPTPFRLKPVPLSLRRDSGTQSRARRITCGTGFSREEASVDTLKFAVCPPTPSRLKPVPLKARDSPVVSIQSVDPASLTPPDRRRRFARHHGCRWLRGRLPPRPSALRSSLLPGFSGGSRSWRIQR